MRKSTIKSSHDKFDCIYLVFVSIFLCAPVFSSEAMCPPACHCLSNHVWICTNVTSLGDIWNSSRTVVEELTLIHLKDLSNDHLRAPFVSAVSVRRLKIRQSIISSISESFVAAFPYVESVSLEDNQFECSEHILALRKWKRKMDYSSIKLRCSSPDGLAGTDLFLAIKEIARVNEKCPKPCRCVVQSLQSSYSIPNLIVNCSHSNLEEVPISLPKSWVIDLDLSHNEISDVTPLLTASAYQNVSVLNLAHNHVHNIQVPNASSHRNHFRLLNLVNNKLTQLPHYLVHSMGNFTYQPLIMLRNNPWICDCETVKTFQTIANEQLGIIGDYMYLMCGADLEGELISSVAVVQKLCLAPVYSMTIMVIRCVNICCFILIGLALIKTAFELRAMYAVGIFHFFAHLLLPSR